MKLKEELPMIKDIAEYRLLIEKYIEDIQNMNVEDYPIYVGMDISETAKFESVKTFNLDNECYINKQ